MNPTICVMCNEVGADLLDSDSGQSAHMDCFFDNQKDLECGDNYNENIRQNPISKNWYFYETDKRNKYYKDKIVFCPFCGKNMKEHSKKVDAIYDEILIEGNGDILLRDSENNELFSSRDPQRFYNWDIHELKFKSRITISVGSRIIAMVDALKNKGYDVLNISPHIIMLKDP